jgi:nitronate monooxygenase
VKSVAGAAELVARLAAEYETAKQELARKTGFTAGAALAFAAE